MTLKMLRRAGKTMYVISNYDMVYVKQTENLNGQKYKSSVLIIRCILFWKQVNGLCVCNKNA